MNNIKKIGLLLLVLGAVTGLTQAAKEGKPDATLRLSGKLRTAKQPALKQLLLHTVQPFKLI